MAVTQVVSGTRGSGLQPPSALRFRLSQSRALCSDPPLGEPRNARIARQVGSVQEMPPLWNPHPPSGRCADRN
jgi:hypothetical protein